MRFHLRFPFALCGLLFAAASAYAGGAPSLDTAALRKGIEYPKDAVAWGIQGTIGLEWYPAEGSNPAFVVIQKGKSELLTDAVLKGIRALDPTLAIKAAGDPSSSMVPYDVAFTLESVGGDKVGRIDIRMGLPVPPAPAGSDGAGGPGRNSAVAKSDTARYPDYDEFVAVEEVPIWRQAELVGNIHYPEAAQLNNIQGLVIIRALIDREGHVVSTRIDRSVDPALDQAAVDAILRTSFKPARQGGKPVAYWLQLPINFKLSK